MDPASPTPAAATFEADYFAANYRNYAAQNPSWKLAFYHRLLARHLERDSRATRPAVADIGCGLGAWLVYLRQHTNWRLLGSDLSAFAIAHNRSQLPDVDLSLAGATDLPWPAGSLDAVTACDVIEHVPDRDQAAAAISAMLRPGGLFLLVVPVYDGLSGPVIRRLDRDPTHVHKLARQNWVDWMAARFEICEYWGMLRYLLPGGIYLHLPTRVGRAHTPAILLLGRKRDQGTGR